MYMPLALCVALAVVSIGSAQQEQAPTIPAAIQKLRAPLTGLPLVSLIENMNSANTVSFYVNCVIGEGRCNHVGAALRHLLVDLRPGQEFCYGCTPYAKWNKCNMSLM
ncbi:hypothetical protein SK128_014480 [Halocaridina rubra]|uniref:Secreted protein n=1 Tax=Halocaridina rubra TaxID=373956 RepID=A0AAN8ZQY9_HALRR